MTVLSWRAVGPVALFLVVSFFPAGILADTPSTSPELPTTQPAAESYDTSGYLTGDWFGSRRWLSDHGITIEPYLILDDSQNFAGGVKVGNSFRERFNFPIQIDTQKLIGLPGGTLLAVYQFQGGGNASRSLTGDAQNFAFGTNANGRSQLGQLWYEQKFFDDTFRIRLGKQDGNTDFDVLDNGVDFLNNSFSTSPTLALLPSFPDTGMGIQAFFEPKCGWYLGAGVFDGSGARGIHTGSYGPVHFFDDVNDLFFIAETGQRFKLLCHDVHLPGKIALGGWWDTNRFPRLDGAGTQDGNGGVYLTEDQVLWKPSDDDLQSLAWTFSIGWCDSAVNFIDGNLLGGLVWTGPLPMRKIDELGLGATAAHFATAAMTRQNYELSVELFYRIRFTPAISLKPDIQYIINPTGQAVPPDPVRNNALVATLRLEVSF